MNTPKILETTKFDSKTAESVIEYISNKPGIIVLSGSGDAWIEPALQALVEQFVEQGKKIIDIEVNYFKDKDTPETYPSLFPESIPMYSGSPDFLAESVAKAKNEHPDIIILQPMRSIEDAQAVFELAKEYQVITSVHVISPEFATQRFADFGLSQEIISSVPMIIVGAKM